jgi:hypothetical protein
MQLSADRDQHYSTAVCFIGRRIIRKEKREIKRRNRYTGSWSGGKEENESMVGRGEHA